eukprot:12749998-Alexandrium_andersonii.AAC.1
MSLPAVPAQKSGSLVPNSGGAPRAWRRCFLRAQLPRGGRSWDSGGPQGTRTKQGGTRFGRFGLRRLRFRRSI